MTMTARAVPAPTVRRHLRAAAAAAALLLALADPTGSVASARAADRESESAALEERVRALEEQIRALRVEIERLRAASPSAAAAGGLSADEIQARIDALAREIERLRIGAAAEPQAAEGLAGFGPAASKVYRARRGVSIGGYGEMVYQGFAPEKDDGTPSGRTDEVDFLRAVMYFGYKFDDRFVFNSEIEFEHAVAGDGDPGEVAVEFAYIDFRATRSFGARGGLLLAPVGFLNELHEPPIFHGALRPQVERFILPTTWRENGLGVYGEAGPVAYRAYLMASLDASGFSAGSGIRGGRQSGAQSTARDLAVTARVDYTPSPAWLLGASAWTGETGQGAAAAQDARLTLFDLHAQWRWRGVQVRGLFAQGILSDAEGVSVLTGQTVGERQRGWYGEVAWNVLAARKKGEQDLSPFVRYESFDTQARVAPGASGSAANDRSVWTYGLTYRPIPNIAIKADVMDFDNRAGSGIDQVNLALGYLF